MVVGVGASTCTTSYTIKPVPTVADISENSAVFSPATVVSKNALYTGTLTVSYTGGNGANYSASPIASTGVTGLTATLVPGILSNGIGGIFVFNITGTPTNNGTASFNLNIFGNSG